MMNFKPYLEDLARRIDPEKEEEIWSSWRDFADGKTDGDAPFEPPKRVPSLPTTEYPKININDAIEDLDLMVLSQLATCSELLANPSSKVLWMRSNYGVGIIPSMFGAEKFIMPRENNTLPNVLPLGGTEAIEKIVNNPLPDFSAGFGRNVFECGEKYKELLKDYPLLEKYILIDHPDCQSSMDVCELLWGSDIFVDLYDNEELVLALLEKITLFIEQFLSKWFELFPVMGYHAFFGRLHKGNITLRDDSAMNLSPDFCKKFMFDFDEKILNYFGGGEIHFCGKGDHFIEKMSAISGLNAIDMSQPHLNDMEKILTHTIDKNIHLFTVKGDYLATAGGHKLSRLSLL